VVLGLPGGLLQFFITSCGERESRPFREELETFISILTSTTPMHLEPFNALSTAGTSTATGQESSTC